MMPESSLPSLGAESAVSAFLLQSAERAVDKSTDGEVIGSWHLTFVNHAGVQQDRLVLLSERALFRVNVDFKKGCVNHSTRLPLDAIESVTAGPLALESENSQKSADAVSKHYRSSKLSTRPHAVNIVMKNEFVDATEPAGVLGSMFGRLMPKDKAGLRMTCFLSQSDHGSPEPDSGPRCVHSLESALKERLPESTIHEGQVNLAIDPIGAAVAASVGSLSFK
eukprot:CAMPEP_0115848278 /NCGR_PEP_ID=MMETSP0287-20121206/10838_1 /TAXON_ID=412157 /ORGANISM="Chrysochromulina rotalis, Strain UIO044" /LENGTH=222 /DNA_ID=CAMNT_0003302183 /DNA_START=10 /DNA_END=678 /DNA_ORIENTATION=-